MIKKATIALSVVATLALSACGHTMGERLLSGGAIGAGTGALVGAATGGDPATGAVIGGLGGAAVGGMTR